MDQKSLGEKVYNREIFETLYTETYGLGFACARVEVIFDFDNSLLFFHPIRIIGDHPVNDLKEQRAVMPKTHKGRKNEVQRVVRLLKDETYVACKLRGLFHDFDGRPEWRHI